jgi:hypothetical protein
VPNGILITDVDDFKKLDPDTQRVTMFENLVRIGEQSKCQATECDEKYIQKAKIGKRRLPISRVTFFVGMAVVIFLFGAGIFKPEEFVKWVKFILPFI